MAITRTARGKAQTAAGGAVTLTATSGAFTPAPGSIVVVCVGMDMQVPTAHANVSNETISVSDTFGGSGGGTWTRAASCVKPPPAAAGQYIQHSEIWYRVIGTAHLTAAEARRLGIDVPAPRARTTRRAVPRARAVSVCHDCGARFDTDAAETRHVAATFHARYDIEVT